MIVARAGGGLRIVTQVAHQEQCGLIAERWGNAAFARPEPWDPVVVAAGMHDEGWRGWEESPQVLPDGRPQGFTDMPIDEHVAIHRSSAAAAGALGDPVALLVAMHGAGLLMRRLGLDGAVPPLDGRPAAARSLVEDTARAARTMRPRLGADVAVAAWQWSAYRILQAIDLLSLYLTWRGLVQDERWTLPRVPRCTGDDRGVALAVAPAGDLRCAVHPWPFADDRVDAPVACRVIPDAPYRSAAHLAKALAGAPVQVLPFVLVAA